MLHYGISTVVLAALLFIPASKLIWVLSVRRLERKGGRALNDAERQGQQTRARVIAAVLCVVFAALFNGQLMDVFAGG
ncbi:MAG: hypothetical protein QF926_12470 [Alphaproteobacteria bacterium]|jgi:hypothetical protein|nr:hypothetical protein [Alphaproteobacteria bacterium]|tara:strand:- start:437 stop:670 length:234 start_codon:yes stop_codon:yes gene_type:complete